MSKKIDILVPVYNEEKVIGLFLEKVYQVINAIKNYDFEILFINDGSKDKTLDLIKEYKIKDGRISYVSLSRNFGKETAMIAGVDHSSGDALIFIDADLQDPPELIPEMISLWEQGYEDVYARRRSRHGESFLKKITAKMYYELLQSVTSVEIQKDTGDYRLLDKKCVDALKRIRETNRNSKGIFSWIGFKKKEIMFDRAPRAAGTTKWNFKKLMNLAIDGITSFTTSPLRISFYLAVPILLAFVFYFIYIMAQLHQFSEECLIARIAILLVLLFAGIQIALLGIIGEYLGRIFNESKNRPLYFVEEEGKSKYNIR